MKLYPEMRTIPAKDRWLFNAIFLIQHFFPASSVVKKWKDAARFRIAKHLRKGGAGKTIPIERLENLSPEEFREHYLSKGRPVVIKKGAANWVCSEQWSFANFKKRFSQDTIKLIHRKGLANDDFTDKVEFTEEMKFGDFLDQVLNGGMKYMRFSPLLERFPELQNDFDQEFLQNMPGATVGNTYMAFIGGAGTSTPLHNAPTPFFFVNVSGTKRWSLIPNHYLPVLNPNPDGFGYNNSDVEIDRMEQELFPGFESIDRMETVLEAGDILYCPSWMWHCVRNESPTIGVRCGFLHLRSMLGESPALVMIRLLAARNPTIWEGLYYTFIARNLSNQDNMLVTPSIVRPKK